MPSWRRRRRANRIRQSSRTRQLLELRRLKNQRTDNDNGNGQLPSVEAGRGTGLRMQSAKAEQ
jgi:hypothetical protein